MPSSALHFSDNGVDIGVSWRQGAALACLARFAAAAALVVIAAQAQATTYTPGAYSYTVPAGVTRVKVQVAGGGGGMGGSDDGNGVTGGRGHVISTTLNVTPGQVISGTVGAGGIRGAQGTASAGGAGGAGTGSGGSGGASGATGYSGSGGGGGGGSSLALDGTFILKAGGGGGGQGAAKTAPSNLAGGNSSTFTTAANCSTSGNGVAGTAFTSGDGGGGGGGGGGYTGGAGGTGHADGVAGGVASGGGASCRSSNAALFAVTPTVASGNQATGVVVSNGPAGYVTIDPEVNATLTKAFGASSIEKGASATLTFTLTNPSGASAQTGLAFTDTLPSGLVLASAPTTPQCGGTIAGTAGGSTIALSAGTLTAGASSCTITATVTSAAAQGAATCPAATTTNGASNISGLASNVTNDVTDQCLGITETPAVLTLQKAMGGSGRISASDQFTLSATGTGAPAAVTTTGSGIEVTSAAYTFTATAGASYTLNEAMAPGSASALSAYTQGVTCGNVGGPTNVSGITTLPISITPAAGDNITCTITNYPTTEPGGGTSPDPGPTPVCNADPIIGGTDWLNAAWSRSGWGGNQTNLLFFTSDTANATVSQAVTGVTPGATVSFIWKYNAPNDGPANQGNPLRLRVYYGGTLYWSADSAPVGSTSGPAATLSNGATCVSGCEALANGDLRTVEFRLPTSIPANGTLQFQAQVLSSGTASDDINLRGPITIKNTGICLAKTSVGSTGTFNYTTSGVDTTMGGGGTTASITTAAVNTARYYDASGTRTNNQPLLITSPGATANVTIGETPATGFVLESVSCPGLSPVRTGNSITIANVPRDTVTTCTFTNRTPIIHLSKALGGNRFATSDNFSVAIRTGGVAGTVVSSSAAATTTGSGSTIDSGTGTTGDFYTVPGTTYTLTEAGVSGANLTNYAATLTCTDSAGVTPAGTLPTNEAFDPAAGRAITPVAGANLRCVITNNPRPKFSLQKVMGGSGRISASDQFALSATGTGAPAAVTTTGSGIEVTSAAYTFTGTAGASYTLNEAMAPGSASALSAYTQGVTCGNVGGPTNVSGITTLPISITPAAGDNISCVITNYPTTEPGGGSSPDPGPVPVCNANPVIASSNWLDPAWTRSGWNGNFGGQLYFTVDSANASVSQDVAGVTPGATVSFIWRFTAPNNGAATLGNPLRLRVYYGGTLYWAGESAPVGSSSGPVPTLSNGATCVSGCEALPNADWRTVEIRLPTSIPANGTLLFQAQTLMPPTASDDINLAGPVTIKNTGICLAKTSLGSTGTFNYTTSGVDTTMGGGGTTASITTAAVNTARYYDASGTRTNNQPLLITSPGATANVTIGETPATGFVLESVSCPGLSPVRTGNSISIANVPRDTVTTCTFTNRAPIINLSKSLAGSRLGAADQFSVAIRTDGPNGTAVSSSATATTTGSGSTIDSGTGTTGDFYTVPGTTYTLTEAGAGGANMANYSARLTCSDAAGVTPPASLPTNESFNPAVGRAITPVTGANLRCVITNSPGTPTVSGRVFLDNGQGAGTANDGILNGGEGPLANVTLRLTNCASTVHATVQSDAAGGYSLPVPTSVASGAALCVEEVNPTTRVSTGASVGSIALPSGAATSVSGSSYTYTRTGPPERIAFTWNGTGHANLNFGDVDNSTFAASGAKTGSPGNAVTYGHTFTAGTAGTVRFTVASETATPAITGWTTQIYADTGCTGSLQPGAQMLYPPAGTPAAVAAGANVCVIVRQFIPAAAPLGASNDAAVQAEFTYTGASPALSASYTLNDVTTVSNVALDLKKEVRNLTQGASFGISNQAKSGETLEYRITYTNNSDAPISAMKINDITPAYTTFVRALAGTTPATLSACAKQTPANPSPGATVDCADVQAVGGTGPIEWRFTGSIAPGGTGSVLFQVKVD